VNAVKHTRGKAGKDPGTRFAKLVATHEQHCAELSRAMNRWQKSRKALWAAEKRLDKAWTAAADAIPEFNDTL
jgi:exonuclease VII small subunit